MRKLALAIPSLILLTCTQKMSPQDEQYFREQTAWRAERAQSLNQPYGWKSLAGLFWLDSNKNTFQVGSNEKMEVLLPKQYPEKLGEIKKSGDTFSFHAATPGWIYHDKEIVGPVAKLGMDENKDFLQYKTLRLFLIKRSKGVAVRLKDSQSEALTNPKPLKWHPIESKYRIKARFVKEETLLSVPDILGGVSEEKSLGFVEFEWAGKNYKLWGLPADNNLWIIFRDQSSQLGAGSYPSGRFLTVEGPIKDVVTLDFNRAVNPPCAYTPWATCPLPPLKNILPISLAAGEAYENSDKH